jgi:hypothetical protein
MSFKWIGKLVKWVLQHPEVIELGESIVRSALKKREQEQDAEIEATLEQIRAEEQLAADVAKRTGRQPKKRKVA